MCSFLQVAFQDGLPFMLLSEESLVDLNARLKKPVSMNNFRPNLVVEGCDAFDEVIAQILLITIF